MSLPTAPNNTVGAGEPGPGEAGTAAATQAPSSDAAIPTPGTGSTGQQDALDKGVDTTLKHFGHGQNASTTEKISDGVRSAFHKVTGKDVPIQDKQ